MVWMTVDTTILSCRIHSMQIIFHGDIFPQPTGQIVTIGFEVRSAALDQAEFYIRSEFQHVLVEA